MDFDKQGNPTFWWFLFALPLICLLCTLHFVVCSVLTVCVHPENRRYKFYEYYAPWGWGKRGPDEQKPT